MFVLSDSKHFHELNAVLRSVSVEMVVEYAEGLLGILLDLPDLWDPVLKLLLGVAIIIPRPLTVPVPAEVSD